MRFGRTLRNSIYEPWKDHYIDYSKLKQLLRDDGSSEKGSPNREDEEKNNWTEDDEGKFVEELINVQLEKVNEWQVETYKQLRDRTTACESKLQPLLESAVSGDDRAEPTNQVAERVEDGKGDGENKDGEQENAEADADTGANTADKDADSDKTEKQSSQDGHKGRQAKLRDVLKELDNITKETNELEKFSRINFTGFLKAAKKHDRRRGRQYRVRPLLQVRLSALPFNSEDYSPLLYR